MTRSEDKKFDSIISQNTFFFHNDKEEAKYQKYLQKKTKQLLQLKKQLKLTSSKNDVFVDFLMKEDEGLEIILALIGLSNETFLRLVTITRTQDYVDLSRLLKKSEWGVEEFKTEWTDTKIKKLCKENKKIATGIINLFLKGSKCKTLQKILPEFELKKLDKDKISFSTKSLLDTIIRYKFKGSYNGLKWNNPEIIIEEIFKEKNIIYTRGKPENVTREMDFVIPTLEKPEILIEVSFVSTTASGMGDKAKTEIVQKQQIAKNYPNCKFIGFIDGIGWYVRHGDLERMVSAYDDAFTFSSSELSRFKEYLKKNISSDCYAKKKKKNHKTI